MTIINKHWGNLDEEVLSVIKAHPEWYGSVEGADLLHASFYDVVDGDGNLLAFFANAYWSGSEGSECHLCYVYVKEEHRRKGIFTKIVKWTLNHNQEYNWIVIGAQDGNELAKSIYSRKFEFSRHDDVQRGDWFVIKGRKRG